MKLRAIDLAAIITASTWDYVLAVIIWIKLFFGVTCGCVSIRKTINVNSQYRFNIQGIYCVTDAGDTLIAPKKYSNLLSTFWSLPYIDKNVPEFKRLLNSFGLSEYLETRIHIYGQLIGGNDLVPIIIDFNLKTKNYEIKHQAMYDYWTHCDDYNTGPNCIHKLRFSMNTFDLCDILEALIGRTRCEMLEHF